MQKNSNKSVKKTNSFKPYITSIITAAGFYAVCFFIFAFIAYRTDISENKYPFIMLITTFLSSAFGGYLLSRKLGKNGILNGIIGSMPALFITYLPTVIFNSGVPGKLCTVAMIIALISGAASGILAVNLRR